ncbi:MAG: chemotaxis protein CheX [Terracidiphilus sp.]
METAVSQDTVVEIVESIFSTMLEIDVSPSNSPHSTGGERMTSTVYLEGDWNGAVSLECNRSQACQFAGRFLATDPPAAVDDDVKDALGELVNMIGGNIKSILAQETRLSMPSVIDGHDYELRICGSQSRDVSAFQFFGGTFWVTVLDERTSRTN